MSLEVLSEFDDLKEECKRLIEEISEITFTTEENDAIKKQLIKFLFLTDGLYQYPKLIKHCRKEVDYKAIGYELGEKFTMCQLYSLFWEYRGYGDIIKVANWIKRESGNKDNVYEFINVMCYFAEDAGVSMGELFADEIF